MDVKTIKMHKYQKNVKLWTKILIGWWKSTGDRKNVAPTTLL